MCLRGDSPRLGAVWSASWVLIVGDYLVDAPLGVAIPLGFLSLYVDGVFICTLLVFGAFLDVPKSYRRDS